MDISALRILIKQEYDSQEGKREKHFELLNPAYHEYKDEADLHQEHLKIIQEYKNTPTNRYPRIDEIIEDIKKNLAYAQKMKKEHTVFEEDIPKIESKPDHSNTEIQQKYLKRYQVPAQYRHICTRTRNRYSPRHRQPGRTFLPSGTPDRRRPIPQRRLGRPSP